jgi:hypothetical protein
MWNSWVQAAEVSQRRTAVSSKCFQLHYTCSDRLLTITLPSCPFHLFPLLLWCVLSSQLFCVHYTEDGSHTLVLVSWLIVDHLLATDFGPYEKIFMDSCVVVSVAMVIVLISFEPYEVILMDFCVNKRCRGNGVNKFWALTTWLQNPKFHHFLCCY